MATINSSSVSGTCRVIRPASKLPALDFGEIWRSRELLYSLTMRDLKIRYKQTVLGAAWAIIQPLLLMVVFSMVFGRFARLNSEGSPYPLFAYCGLLAWQLFAQSVTGASGSLVQNDNLVTKVYFARILLPASMVCAALVDFTINFLLFLLMICYYGVHPSVARLFLLPAAILLALTAGLGVGLWLCALNVRYRDVRYTLAFLIQLGLFATPVAYSSTLVPLPLRPLYAINPMVGVIEGFRSVFLGSPVPWTSMLLSIVVSTIIFISGLWYFRVTEDGFADLI